MGDCRERWKLMLKMETTFCSAIDAVGLSIRVLELATVG